MKDIPKMVYGLNHLLGEGITHCNLKPGNVLISNPYYSHCTEEESNCLFERCPIMAKLADFGEAQSQLFHTKLCTDQDTWFGRGGLPFAAPKVEWESTSYIFFFGGGRGIRVFKNIRHIFHRCCFYAI